MRLLYILILLFVASMTTQAQVSTETLKQISKDKAHRYSTFLNLDSEIEAKLANIYYKYDLMLAEENKSPTNYFDVVEKNAKERDFAISKLLNQKSYKNYQILAEMDQQETKDYYSTISNSMASNENLTKEISHYMAEYVFPILSKYKIQFDEKIKPADLRRMNDLVKEIYNQMDRLNFDRNGDPLLNQNISKEQNKLNLSELLEYGNKYDVEYSEILQEMDPYVEQWKKSINEIVAKNYAPSQVKAIREAEKDLAISGAGNSINLLSFMLIEPYNVGKYYKNLSYINYLKRLIESR